MLIVLAILLCGLTYALVAAATHGYAKHRWPSERSIYGEMDDNDKRTVVPLIWPIYWIFIWPVVKVNELTFSSIEKHAARQIAKNKVRIETLQAARAEVEASNKELEEAEVELEKEVHKL